MKMRIPKFTSELNPSWTRDSGSLIRNLGRRAIRFSLISSIVEVALHNACWLRIAVSNWNDSLVVKTASLQIHHRIHLKRTGLGLESPDRSDIHQSVDEKHPQDKRILLWHNSGSQRVCLCCFCSQIALCSNHCFLQGNVGTLALRLLGSWTKELWKSYATWELEPLDLRWYPALLKSLSTTLSCGLRIAVSNWNDSLVVKTASLQIHHRIHLKRTGLGLESPDRSDIHQSVDEKHPQDKRILLWHNSGSQRVCLCCFCSQIALCSNHCFLQGNVGTLALRLLGSWTKELWKSYATWELEPLDLRWYPALLKSLSTTLSCGLRIAVSKWFSGEVLKNRSEDCISFRSTSGFI